MLSRWYGTGTVVLFADDYLQALHYAKQSGIPLQNQLDLVSVRGWNTLQRALDQNFTKIACLHEVTRYKQLEHELRWGDIIRKNNDGFPGGRRRTNRTERLSNVILSIGTPTALRGKNHRASPHPLSKGCDPETAYNQDPLEGLVCHRQCKEE
jgi:hypothetical protein